LNRREQPETERTPVLKRSLPQDSIPLPAVQLEENLALALNMLVSGRPIMMKMGLKTLKRMAPLSTHDDLDDIYTDMLNTGDAMVPTEVKALVKVPTAQKYIYTILPLNIPTTRYP
jgi:hypothetical protein